MPGLLVHEWIENDGGAEKVLEEMAATFPDAAIYCLWDDSDDRFEPNRVMESWLSRTPLRRHKALALPFMPATWRKNQRSAVRPDWVLLSSHLFAHHFGSSQDLSGVRKLAYVYTPARYLWAPESDPRGSSLAVRSVGPIFRAIDRRRAQDIDEIAAISEFIRERIARAWGRDSRVIYPPVAVRELQAVRDWREQVPADELRILDNLPPEFLFGASRLVSYKRLDVVIEAGIATGYPVVIAGSGPHLAALRAKARDAGVQVTFVGRVSDAMMRALYQRALVYVFPPVEDFGIMPVEAMSLGTPVVVNRVGGAAESVKLLRGGSAAEDLSRASLRAAVDKALRADMKSASANASDYFGIERFVRQLKSWVNANGEQD